MCCELVIFVWSIIYLVIAVRERGFLGGEIFMENMQLCPSRVLFLIACALVILCAPLRSLQQKYLTVIKIILQVVLFL